MFQCILCFKECKSLRSVKSHQAFCPSNPNKSRHNHSLAGKKGNIATRRICANKSEQLKSEYLENPKLCTQCACSISFNKRQNKFCSQSCAAKFNNKQPLRRNKKINIDGELKEFRCLNCNDLLNVCRNSKNKYCSSKCQHELAYKERIEVWGKTGQIGKAPLKRYLSEVNNSCWTCGITDWNSKPIVFEVEHIDGNSDNNSKNNVSLICPNCHSQTDTYKGKNKGSGRYARRQRYRDGKSY